MYVTGNPRARSESDGWAWFYQDILRLKHWSQYFSDTSILKLHAGNFVPSSGASIHYLVQSFLYVAAISHVPEWFEIYHDPGLSPFHSIRPKTI